MKRVLIALALLVVFLLVQQPGQAQTWQELMEQADSLSDAQNQDSAITLGNMALGQVEREFGTEDTTLAGVLHSLGNFHYINADYTAAEEFFVRTVSIVEKALGPEHPDMADYLNDLAACHYNKGNYADAKPLYDRALAIQEKHLGNDHEKVARTLIDLANLYYQEGDYAQAGSLVGRAITIQEKTLGADDPSLARSLNTLAAIYIAQGKYSSAASVFERALSILEESSNPDPSGLVSGLNNLAHVYVLQGLYADAVHYLERAIDISEKTFGSEHRQVASALSNLAVVRYYEGDYLEAESLFKRVLAIEKASAGEEDASYATNLENLASVYKGQARYADAELLQEQALTLKEKLLGPDHPELGISANNLADLYQSQGKLSKAEFYYQRALQIWENSLGPDHPNVAAALSNLAALYLEKGVYARAEPMYVRAIAIRENVLGPDHPDVAFSLTGLADLYRVLGKYRESHNLLEKSLRIWENALGPDHPYVAGTKSNLATSFFNQGQLSEAEQLYIEALADKERSLGADHPDVAQSLNDLAKVYKRQGRHSEADSLYVRAIRIWERALGADHPTVAKARRGLAGLYISVGQYSKAESLCLEACESLERTHGPNSLEVANTLSLLAKLYRLLDRPTGSLQFADRAFWIRYNELRDFSQVMSERDALGYASKMRSSADQYLSCYIDSEPGEESMVAEASRVVLASKGQVSDEIFGRHRLIVTETDSTTQALVESVKCIRFRLSKLYVAGPGEDTTNTYRHRLDSLDKLANSLESSLARRGAGFRKNRQRTDINAEQFLHSLPPKSVLVEYLRYNFSFPTTNDSTEPRYLVVVFGQRGGPMIEDLAPAESIDSVVAQYQRHFQAVSRKWPAVSADEQADISRILSDLYTLVWQPVADEIGDADIVFVAPDGALNLISFASLKNGSAYLVEKHAIHYLSAGRDIVRLEAMDTPGTGLFALGDPDYNASALSRLERGRTGMHSSVGLSSVSQYAVRNMRSGCKHLHEITVDRLPYTRREVEQVIELWKSATSEPVETYLQASASEENFKESSFGKRILHLATHGFFRPGECDVANRLEQPSGGFIGESPLLQSGLFLAGANLHGAGSDSLGTEDGILTAEEVCGMNLTGTQWVVLSACESGLGEVEAGEGLFGLRRSFQLAGARTVISSLWPVPDKETSRIMKYLYGHQGSNLAVAFRNMALEELREMRTRKLPDDPYPWASFIALGDWKM